MAAMPQPGWPQPLVMQWQQVALVWLWPCAKYRVPSALYLWSHLCFWLAWDVNTIVTPFTDVETNIKQVIKDISGSVTSLVFDPCLSPPRSMLQVPVKKPFPLTSHTILWLLWRDREKRQTDFWGRKFRVMDIHPSIWRVDIYIYSWFTLLYTRN